MRNFILGTVFGIVVATIGFSGLAALADRGVTAVKEMASESTRR